MFFHVLGSTVTTWFLTVAFGFTRTAAITGCTECNSSVFIVGDKAFCDDGDIIVHDSWRMADISLSLL